MTIDTEALILAIENARPNESWVVIKDSRGGVISKEYSSSIGGDEFSDWKIHISIDPEKVSHAAVIVAEVLNKAGAPRATLKFVTKHRANSSQPGKQIALIFEEDLSENNIRLIGNVLSNIEFLLDRKSIGRDLRPINSDLKELEYKYDATILESKDKESRFNYRYQGLVVLADDTYEQTEQPEDGRSFLIKQSDYSRLLPSQKHYPFASMRDPFSELRVQPLNFEDFQTVIQHEGPFSTPTLPSESVSEATTGGSDSGAPAPGFEMPAQRESTAINGGAGAHSTCLLLAPLSTESKASSPRDNANLTFDELDQKTKKALIDVLGEKDLKESWNEWSLEGRQSLLWVLYNESATPPDHTEEGPAARS